MLIRPRRRFVPPRSAAAWSLWPINKALWTPTFALINAAIGLALLAAAQGRPGRGSATSPPVRLAPTLGSVALTLYVVHALLTAIAA